MGGQCLRLEDVGSLFGGDALKDIDSIVGTNLVLSSASGGPVIFEKGEIFT